MSYISNTFFHEYLKKPFQKRSNTRVIIRHSRKAHYSGSGYLFKTLRTTSAISWKSNVPVRTNKKYLLFGSRLSNEKSFVKPPVVSNGAFQNFIILATRSKNKYNRYLKYSQILFQVKTNLFIGPPKNIFNSTEYIYYNYFKIIECLITIKKKPL
jgi:hypothetical protein